MKPLSELLPRIESILCQQVDLALATRSYQPVAEYKKDGSIVTATDKHIQSVLTTALSELLPEAQMLGEELTSAQQQEVIDSNESFWCLDPIDGTNNFYHGVPLFAVSLALIQHGEIVLGLVYDPIRKECFSCTKGTALKINGAAASRPEQPDRLEACLASIDFKRLTPSLSRSIVGQMPFKSQRNIGTCALEWAWLAAGRIQLLLHGGEKIWDYAAGTLLLDSAGGVSCSKPGEPVFNLSLTPRPVIAASNENLQHCWLQYLSHC